MSGRLYVVAGELSGDAHGAGLLRALAELRPGVSMAGAGGPEMAAVSGGGVTDWVENAAVVGLWEVLKHYSWFKERFHSMLEEVRKFRPDVLLLIDYPGFNLRFAAAVKRDLPHVRLVYYISPQVWAWHKGRIPGMARLLDEMLCILPFERPIFEQAGLKTTFVGHPLVDELEERRLPGVERDPRLVGWFPGSRRPEVERLFPVMVETARCLVAWRRDLQFEAPAASGALAEQMREIVSELRADGFVTVTDGGAHSLMQRAGCAVIASGTATLEAAYFGLPYCLVYKLAWPTYLAAKILVRIKHIGLVNILAQREVVEEFIQGRAAPEPLGVKLRQMIDAPEERVALQHRLAETAAMLGGKGAHKRAATAVAGWFDA